MGIENGYLFETTIEQDGIKISDIIDEEKIKDLKSITEVDIAINNIILLQKEHQNVLGIPGKHHDNQSQEVLENQNYWEICNIMQLLELRRKVILGEVKNFASFTGGGSIGSGYLGALLSEYERGNSQDVIFGYSAGSLFPAIFMLWKKAKEINPDDLKGKGLDSIMEIIPAGFEDKSMFMNGEELIKGFILVGQNLIDIINKKLSEKDKLHDINEISIGEINPNFKIINSRKDINGGFQRVIMGGRDNLMNAVIGSSNPELSILGGLISFNVLTSERNHFYGNYWNDGYHTISNQMKYGNILGIIEKKEFISIDEYRSKDEIGDYEYLIPSLQVFILGKNWRKNEYEIIDQNSGWGEDEVKLRILMAYYRYLSLSNIGDFLTDIEKYIKNPLIIKKVYKEIMESENVKYNIGDIRKIHESLKKIRGLKKFTYKQATDLIIKIYYEKVPNSNEVLPKISFLKYDGDFKLKLTPKDVTTYINMISFIQDNEDYSKIILELIDKKTLFEEIQKMPDKEKYDILEKLYAFTRIFDDMPDSFIYKIIDYNKEHRGYNNYNEKMRIIEKRRKDDGVFKGLKNRRIDGNNNINITTPINVRNK